VIAWWEPIGQKTRNPSGMVWSVKKKKEEGLWGKSWALGLVCRQTEIVSNRLPYRTPVVSGKPKAADWPTRTRDYGREEEKKTVGSRNFSIKDWGKWDLKKN